MFSVFNGVWKGTFQLSCRMRQLLMALGPAIRDTRVTCAVGHSVYRGVAAEGEVDGADAADGPATFARR